MAGLEIHNHTEMFSFESRPSLKFNQNFFRPPTLYTRYTDNFKLSVPKILTQTFLGSFKSWYLLQLCCCYCSKLVVDQNILSPGGTVVVDNALIFGYVYIDDCTSGLGKGVKDLNDYLKTRDDLFRVSMKSGIRWEFGLSQSPVDRFSLSLNKLHKKGHYLVG